MACGGAPSRFARASPHAPDSHRSTCASRPWSRSAAGETPMKPSRLTILLLLVLTTTASAALVTGQHASCEAVWDTGTAAVTTPPHLDCRDGDPTCDTDGTADHICHVVINACVGTPVGSCVPRHLTKLKFGIGASKLAGFAPPIPGGSANCGVPGTATTPLRSKKHGTVFKPSRPLRLLMRSTHFKNTLLVRCLPCAGATCGGGPPPPTTCAAGQKELVLTVPVAAGSHPDLATASALTTGGTAPPTTSPVIGGSSRPNCLSACDATATFACQASGASGAGTPTGPTLGAPRPLLTPASR